MGNGQAGSPSTPLASSLTPSPFPIPATRGIRIALCAGEASGDGLGAGLIAALKARFPNAEFAGIGGDAMRAAGCDTWFDANELAVMGLAEVLRHLPRLLGLRKAFRQRVLDWKPDVYVGIDAPDFNLGIERWLKARGVRTVHYVSPSVWAWREKRAEKIGHSADRVLCLFPMEPPIYARHAVDARFVGHPMADEIPLQPDRATARMALGLPADAPILAVLPGSRLGEIGRLAPAFFEAARRVAAEIPGVQIVVPAANAACRQALETQFAAHGAGSAWHLLDGRARDAMIASDVVLLASGTATLEAMLCKRPMVVGYRIAPLTYRIVKGLGMLKVERYALPNVLAGEDIAPELMQDDCTPEQLSAAILRWFREPAAVDALQPTYLRLHEQLRKDASAKAAEAVSDLIASSVGAT
ncbi:lipid-A-disaccharide synthase [Pseudoxanthomonas sp. LH2527]|uniref:lipid-A-disaccharide synthase n=1 Tax=Pseudoxanthomonas sp. LH2527 TaxID=2923249 RepID=UPI001F134BC6|nr:lipid-A-disaccharide synthase [Pseudoxanthomonas sp. LH2527]